MDICIVLTDLSVNVETIVKQTFNTRVQLTVRVKSGPNCRQMLKIPLIWPDIIPIETGRQAGSVLVYAVTD